MRKRFVIMLFVMGLVVAANAGMTIVIQGPDGLFYDYADSKLTITPSTELVYGLRDDGLTPAGTYALGILSGPGSLSENISVLQDGVSALLSNDAVAAADYGVQSPFISMTLSNSVDGLLWLNTFHCEGEGDVTITAVDENYLIVDSQVIHQVPEPATLVLLGIGGLLLRKSRIA